MTYTFTITQTLTEKAKYAPNATPLIKQISVLFQGKKYTLQLKDGYMMMNNQLYADHYPKDKWVFNELIKILKQLQQSLKDTQ